MSGVDQVSSGWTVAVVLGFTTVPVATERSVITTSLPASPVPETLMPPPAEAVLELSARFVGVYAPQLGSIVVVVVDAVVVEVVVVVGVGVGPGHATASPAIRATSPGKRRRFRVKAVMFMIPLGSNEFRRLVLPRAAQVLPLSCKTLNDVQQFFLIVSSCSSRLTQRPEFAKV